MTAPQLGRHFQDLHPPLAHDQALVEAARCLFCFDAPCTRACPTHIDVPKFIRQILHRNAVGAAKTILQANIFGGSCARACPTEVLCEGACVDQALMKAPVQIGRLQRYACDQAAARGRRFFEPGAPTGKRVAIVGSGPAGLTCADELRKNGHQVEVFEARDVPGGLNTLGIAPYKISTEFALSEVKLVQQLSVDVRLNHPVSAADIKAMLDDYDAVFLGIGLGKTMALGIEGEDLPGVWESLDFIFQTHTRPFEDCEVGQRAVVIGGGNTAIDVATIAVRLGAEQVTIAYRRGPEAMPAFAYEYELAKSDGVAFEWFCQPLRVVASNGAAGGLECVRTELQDPHSRHSPVKPIDGSQFVIHADMIIKALGQQPLVDLLHALPNLEHDRGRIVVEPASGATSVPRLFAGGDCVNGGSEIVDAVQHGKIAAAGIDRMLA